MKSVTEVLGFDSFEETRKYVHERKIPLSEDQEFVLVKEGREAMFGLKRLHKLV